MRKRERKKNNKKKTRYSIQIDRETSRRKIVKAVRPTNLYNVSRVLSPRAPCDTKNTRSPFALPSLPLPSLSRALSFYLSPTHRYENANVRKIEKNATRTNFEMEMKDFMSKSEDSSFRFGRKGKERKEKGVEGW